MPVPKFGLNRFDGNSIPAFAASVKRAEDLGWDVALWGDSQLRRRDPYVCLAAAAGATERIEIGQFVANPITRHPSVIASSTATVEELAPGRTILGISVGDNAVRSIGLKPARVGELESSIRMIKALLAGEEVEVGALRPAFLPHHQKVPIWVAAGGPRALRMAGAVADGIFIRVGTSNTRIASTIEQIRAGAIEAGRDPDEVRFGFVIDTVLVDNEDDALLMAKSMAAGYYELTPALLEDAGIHWQGPSPDELKREHGVWPDFHHYNDLIRSGKLVDFLPREAADLFTLWGPPRQIVTQLLDVIRSAPAALDYVVLQPIPDPVFPDAGDAGYTARVAREVLPEVRAALQ